MQARPTDRTMRPPQSPPPPVAAPAASLSAPAQAAAAAVLALARAARCFVLYDAHNEAVRQHLEAWREKSRAALDAHGALALDVRPHEIGLAGERVYRDEDREKSLAWKLFRDGVRRLTILPEATWAELLVVLQVVALRYTAVRQQEEDAVTLLRAAALRSVQLVATEGYAPEEERPEPGRPDDRAERGVRPPDGWDQPLPRLPAPGGLDHRPLPAAALARLQAEAAPDAIAPQALGLARDLLAEAVRGHWPQPNRDLVAFFGELRDAFLAEGQLGALRELVDLIGAAGAGEVRAELLTGLGDARTLAMVLDGLPPGAELPSELVSVLPLLGLEAALDRLGAEADADRRGLLLKLVLSRVPREADAVLRRLPGLGADAARGLVRGLAARMPERAVEIARLLLQQGDLELRLEGLETLLQAPGELPTGPVAALLDDPAERMRLKAAEVLGRRGDEEALEPLSRALAEGERTPREVEGLGRALAGVAPIRAARLFAEWVQPRARFLVGPNAQQRRLQWAAVAGLAVLPGAEAERQLHALAEAATDDLRRHCLAALALRRKGAARG